MKDDVGTVFGVAAQRLDTFPSCDVPQCDLIVVTSACQERPSELKATSSTSAV